MTIVAVLALLRDAPPAGARGVVEPLSVRRFDSAERVVQVLELGPGADDRDGTAIGLLP